MYKEGENLNAFSKAIRQLRQGFSIRSAASEDVGKLIKTNSLDLLQNMATPSTSNENLNGICCLGYLILCASLKRLCS